MTKLLDGIEDDKFPFVSFSVVILSMQLKNDTGDNHNIERDNNMTTSLAINTDLHVDI